MSRVDNPYRTWISPPVLSVFALGVSSGLPWVMIGSALTLWLKEAGISRTQIGFAGLIFSLYAINFLWSPLVDAHRLPLSRRIGQMRSWILYCQLGVALCCLLMSYFPPPDATQGLIALAFVLALCSATQDIAVGAYRIDIFYGADSKALSASSAAVTAGWWTGYAGIGGLPLWLSDAHWQWPQLYGLMAAIMLLLLFITLLLPDPPRQPRGAELNQTRFSQLSRGLSTARQLRICGLLLLPWLLAIWGFWGCPGLPLGDGKIPVLITLEVGLLVILLADLFRLLRPEPSRTATVAPVAALNRLTTWLLSTLVAPLEEFFVRKGAKFALTLLAFLLVFKLGEAFLGRMSIVFYKDIGYSNSDIATYSKLLTWWATVLFAIPCALLNARFGVFKGLFISGCAMAASNLMFAWIAVVGPDVHLLTAAVLVDGFTQSWSTIAFVSFVSTLCHQSFSATQYTLFAAVGNFGRTTIAANSGFLVDSLNGNWAVFFVLTCLMVIPGLVLLTLLRKRL